MNRERIWVLIVLLFCFIGSYAQSFDVNFYGANPSYDINDLYRLNVVNNSSEYKKVHLLASIKNGSQVVYSGKTAEIDLIPGMNQINPYKLFWDYQNYLSNGFESFVKGTGTFPAGSYTGCITILYNNNEIKTICLEYNSRLLSPPTLVFPVNNHKIQTLKPVLSWLAPVPSVPNAITYNLKLVRVEKDQRPEEAIGRNQSYFTLNDIELTSLLYPPNALPLEFHQTYAWQVEAMVDGLQIGKSQVWSFTPDRKEDFVTKRIENQPYLDLNRSQNLDVLTLIQELNIKYEARGRGVISLDIRNANGEKVELKKREYRTKRGDNLIKVILKEYKEIKHEELYALTIHLQDQKRRVVHFIYLDPDKL